ncbi:protein of unknown function DUF1355 [Gottschalkia purinilytica]|uniref:Uncharacterized protein n=2 Tax=Gottschalkia purinilytica TaxID=1503 RepID=A0A0L0W9D4_GOTPU|nr:protein of unknown function DUF1355 [Gottschalkia purinilytica]
MIIFFVCGTRISYADKEKGNENFKVKFEYGFDQSYRYEHMMPVKIEVKNESRDIEGKIQIITKGYNEPGANTSSEDIYSKSLSLKKGNTKEIDMGMTIHKDRNVIIRILDEKDNVIWEQKNNVKKAEDAEKLLIGVLSDNYDSLAYLNNIPFLQSNEKKKESKVKTIKLKENFPYESAQLKTLDIIVINDFATEKLTKEQVKELEKWIRSGGNLIIGTGDSYEKTLKGLNTINYFKGEKVENINNFNTNTGYSFNSGNPIQIATGQVKDAENLVNIGDNTLVYNKKLNKGNIFTITTNIGMSPFIEWNENVNFLKDIILNYGNISTNKFIDTQNHYYGGNSIVGNIPGERAPSPGIILLIIILFILIVGPINYLILKKLDKREKGWVTIPIIALTFAISMYIWGTKIKTYNVLANNVSVIQFNKNSNNANIYTKTGIITHKTKDLGIKAKENMYLSPEQSDIYNDDESIEKRKVEINFNEKNNLIYRKAASWKSEKISLEGNKNINGIDIPNIKISKDNLQGNIINKSHMDLKDTLLIYNNLVYKVGNIDKNSKKDIDVSLKKMKKTPGINADIYSFTESIYPYNSKEKNHIFSKDLKREILSDNFLKDYGLNDDNTAILIGWNKDNISDDIMINGETPERVDKNLIIIPLDIKYDKGEKISISENVFTPKLLEIEGLRFASPYDKLLQGQGHAIYSFKSPKNIDIESMKIKTTGQGNYPGGIAYIYNNQTKNWDTSSKKSIEIDSSNKELYYDEYKGVVVKLIAGHDGTVEYPSFSLKGVAK